MENDNHICHYANGYNCQMHLDRIEHSLVVQTESIKEVTAQLTKVFERLITIIERKESPRMLQYTILALFGILSGLLFGSSDVLTTALANIK